MQYIEVERITINCFKNILVLSAYNRCCKHFKTEKQRQEKVKLKLSSIIMQNYSPRLYSTYI